MQNLLLLLLSIITLIPVAAQPVASSCEAPDSVKALYNEDAHRLALQKIYRRQLPQINTIRIPQADVDTMLHALLAVYNATNLAARDTVWAYKIHTDLDPMMNQILLFADPQQDWMQQLKQGIIPTGNVYIDSFMQTYHLQMTGYEDYGQAHGVHFTSKEFYNIPAFEPLLANVPGFLELGDYSVSGSSAWITDSIYTDHVELTYSYGWGDCPSGCIFRRHWKFKVYFDCSVAFVESYGDALPPTAIRRESVPNLKVYPNPFGNTIQIDGPLFSIDYSISDLSGRQLLKGWATNGRIDNLSQLPEGLYILTLGSGATAARFKISRQ